jgi:SAM-dependent methyltransferase
MTATLTFDPEAATRDRYSAASQAPEQALCCPTSYDPQYLKVLPAEILERDYGCGDPSEFVREGETVLDLGSGGGKICYILSQVVGPTGRVLGVDMNDDMLALAREHQPAVAEKIGHDNVTFHKGKIQDLALSLDAVQGYLDEHPIDSVEAMAAFEAQRSRLRTQEPMIASDSVDVIVSNCVLNLVRPEDKAQLFGEMFRVLKRGGRAVISDIVSDEDPTPAILNDPDLWSGCISGAYREDAFLKAFEDAGFYGVELVKYESEPWQTVDGVEFRSVTVQAYKGKQGPCLERKQAVIYRGPWKRVIDDDGHTLSRGERMALCDKTFKLMTDPHGPYAGQLEAVEPREDIALDDAVPFACKGNNRRDPRETKGQDYHLTTSASDCCGDDGACC